MIKNATIYLLHSFIIWCGGFGIFTLRILYKDYCYYYEMIELFFFFVYIQKYCGVLFVFFSLASENGDFYLFTKKSILNHICSCKIVIFCNA